VIGGLCWWWSDLLLSPWWIAAIVAAGVIILMIVCVFCMFMCRPGPGWGSTGANGRGPANLCFDSESWLACCVMLSWPRDQPYRGRRGRQVYYSGSIDRHEYRGIYAESLCFIRTRIAASADGPRDALCQVEILSTDAQL